MQWDDTANAGFSGGTPWLAVNENYTRINVRDQQQDPDSVLNYYRRLIALRNGSAVLQQGSFTELHRRDGLYAYRRALGEQSVTVVINLSERQNKNPAGGRVLLSNYGRTACPGTLLPYEAVLLVPEAEKQPAAEVVQ